MHQHVQAPANPSDGDRFTCECGYAAEWVDLGDGQPGEWVSLPVLRKVWQDGNDRGYSDGISDVEPARWEPNPYEN